MPLNVNQSAFYWRIEELSGRSRALPCSLQHGNVLLNCNAAQAKPAVRSQRTTLILVVQIGQINKFGKDLPGTGCFEPNLPVGAKLSGMRQLELGTPVGDRRSLLAQYFVAGSTNIRRDNGSHGVVTGRPSLAGSAGLIKGLNDFVPQSIRTAVFRPGGPIDSHAGNPDRSRHVKRAGIGPHEQPGHSQQLAEFQERCFGGEDGMAKCARHNFFAPSSFPVTRPNDDRWQPMGTTKELGDFSISFRRPKPAVPTGPGIDHRKALLKERLIQKRREIVSSGSVARKLELNFGSCDT